MPSPCMGTRLVTMSLKLVQLYCSYPGYIQTNRLHKRQKSDRLCFVVGSLGSNLDQHSVVVSHQSNCLYKTKLHIKIHSLVSFVCYNLTLSKSKPSLIPHFRKPGCKHICRHNFNIHMHFGEGEPGNEAT